VAAPTTTNTKSATTDTAIKAVDSGIVSVVEGLILADVPALALPVIKQIWESLFMWIAGYFTRAAETGATFLIIDYQTGAEVSLMSKALAALVAAEKTGDATAIQAAILQYAQAQSSLVNSDGSAAP
jgi:hypothetical protein